MLNSFINKYGLEPNDPRYPSIERNDTGSIYLSPIMALHVATYLNEELYYEIFEYFLISKVEQIESVYQSKINSLEQDIRNLELGIKLNKPAWIDFEASHAYY
jgi:hypothetical protein